VLTQAEPAPDYSFVLETLDALPDLLTAAQIKRDLTLRDIARETDFNPNTLSRIKRGLPMTVKSARTLLVWLQAQ
jgi:transcriptional regulator with XRE-family HTH domain